MNKPEAHRSIIESLEERRLLTYTNFVHPGVLNTAADFTRMATKVAANAQPWLADWNLLTSDGLAQLGASPRPLVTVVRANTGSNFGQMFGDIRRAYDTALLPRRCNPTLLLLRCDVLCGPGRRRWALRRRGDRRS